MEKKSVSLVLPMFNEIDYIEKTVSKAVSTLGLLIPDFEVIIVDDASNDGSEIIADKLSQNDPRIKVVRHVRNRKLGGVLKSGFSAASKEIVVYTDMDMPFDLSQLSDILPLISGSDIVIGCRIGKRESFRRIVYSWVYNKLINLIFKVGVKDVNFSLKIFKRKILRDIYLKSEGSFVNAEFLAKARKLGYSIKEIKVDYALRIHGFSRLSTFPVICKILYEMVKYYPDVSFFSKKKAIYNRLSRFYKKAGWGARAYNFIRFKTCPFDRVMEFIPKTGNILDFGCGSGILLNILRLEQNKRLLIGLDKDIRKIRVASSSLNGSSSVFFGKIDSDCLCLPKTDVIILTDVMYCLTYKRKIFLLKECFKALEGGGTLIIKDIDTNLNIKFFWAFLQEFLVLKIIGLTSGDGIYFENRQRYISLLGENGFIATRHFDLSDGYLYPHVLYICKKP